MNYTKEQLNVAKQILLNLISDDRILEDEHLGICRNGERHPFNKYDRDEFSGILSFYNFIDEFSMGWEHHSGEESYPVPYNAGDFWEGKNLELRIDLMKYIVNKIDNILEGMTDE